MPAATKIASWFDTGWKIISALIVIIGGIASVVLAWYRIQQNMNDIEELKRDTAREIQLQEDRSDKRFQRAYRDWFFSASIWMQRQ